MKQCLALFFALSVAVAQDDVQPRLDSIIKKYEKLEASSNAVELHTQWLESPAGQEDIAFLAAHYNDLSNWQKEDIPQELARTGLVVTVLLLEKALVHNEEALSGIFYACIVEEFEPGFGKAVAPFVVPWVGRSRHSTSDSAITVLPILDPELASKVFFVEKFVGVNSPTAHLILSSCNNTGLTVPLSVLDPLISAFEDKVGYPDAAYRIWAGYSQAITALAVHDPARAFAKAEALMKTDMLKTQPYRAEDLSELPLLAVGLSGLYDRVADYFDKHGHFGNFPEAAQFFFAVRYFETDVVSIGFAQALQTPPGDHIQLVRKAYREIGDNHSLERLDWMYKPFGESGPSPDSDTRWRQMMEMKPPYFDQESKLRDEWAEDPRSKTHDVHGSWKLSMYVYTHAKEIKEALAKP